MRIGITYDLKSGAPAAGEPDDFYEEFDSPATIEAIAAVLRDLGHEVEKLGDGRELIERLLSHPPELVFNFAEGQGVGRSREARVPALLEMLGIAYSHSDPLTLAVTLDKDWAKRIVQADEVPVPWGTIIQPDEDPRPTIRRIAARCPVIAKPAWEGSSKGIRRHCVLERPEDLPAVVAALGRDYRQPVLVEQFIEGDELTVGIIGNNPPQVIGVMRVVPLQPTNRFVYGLDVKRDYERQVRYECPAPLEPHVYETVSKLAVTAYRSLGCRDVARIDFRLRAGVAYFLEANPLPGLNPRSSDLVILARLRGWSYAQLIGKILQSALDRQGNDKMTR
jgi:D-alanine-D-alanine ligase